MPISLNPQMMRAIIMDHYDNPQYKKTPSNKDEFKQFHMSSSNCIDDIIVYALEKDGIIKECYWDGVACTISTASTDIMCGLVINKSIKDATYIIEQYKHMIHEEEFDESVLDEAIAFVNTSKQAARIKCATIGYDALEGIICNHEHKK